MHDFERALDIWDEYLAEIKDKEAYHLGYSRGKIRARWEVVIFFTVIYFVVVAIEHYST